MERLANILSTFFEALIQWFDKQVFVPEAPMNEPQNTPVKQPETPLPAELPTQTTTDIPQQPEVAPSPVDIENSDVMYPDWNTTAHARHNVRVICDQERLTLDQKNILTACVANESGFLTNPRPNQNKLKDGTVWSTDWGIVQVNDYYNIGIGKPFPSVDYVLSHPEACVRWMAQYYKQNGNLNAWASYTTGVYKHYL